uniref:Uncharacterized protein n=1 Tax=Arundo donax TaxID=35708 RepID=A0A0A8ZHM4_ARUDO
MSCVRCAATSSKPLANAMCVASPLTTGGATLWSALWSPFTSHARMPPTAAPPVLHTMTSTATARSVLTRRAAAWARTGSTEALLDHFTRTHGWPCATKIRAGKTRSICLHDGFNFLLADRTTNSQGATTSHSQYLFLLNVVRQPLGRAISVLFIGQESSSQVLKCVLSYSRRLYDPGEHHRFLGNHLLQSEINVECTDLSNGLPNPEGGFLFVVPDFVLGDDDRKNTIQVKARIRIVDLD